MLSLSDILELKNEIKLNFGAELHFHDVCPKPFFTLDSADKAVEDFIVEYLAERKQYPRFSENHLQFIVER